MSVQIFKLTPYDVGLAQQLLWYFQVDDGIANPTRASDAYIGRMLARADFHVVIALQGQQVVGGLTAYELDMYKEETTEMFLYEIGVDTQYRQQGIAKALIEFLKTNICLPRNITEMYVGTEMDNLPAQKLYKATGGGYEPIAWYVYRLQ